MDSATWAAALREAMAAVYTADEFDLVTGDDGAELELMTDDWTLQVELGRRPVAWLAVDLEPDTAAEARAALQAVMSDSIVHALGRADERLDGALVAALARSGDLLSLELLAALKTG